MDPRDAIAMALMNQMVPSAWPVAPGEAPVMMVPPNERDMIERAPVITGEDLNAIQGQDVMDQYFFPTLVEEEV
jgi:hypothetical protein